MSSLFPCAIQKGEKNIFSNASPVQQNNWFLRLESWLSLKTIDCKSEVIRQARLRAVTLISLLHGYSHLWLSLVLFCFSGFICFCFDSEQDFADPWKSYLNPSILLLHPNSTGNWAAGSDWLITVDRQNSSELGLGLLAPGAHYPHARVGHFRYPR